MFPHLRLLCLSQGQEPVNGMVATGNHASREKESEPNISRENNEKILEIDSEIWKHKSGGFLSTEVSLRQRSFCTCWVH